MAVFQSIEINNFRGIRQLKIDNLKSINLFVGRNNSGKTTVLEAIFLLTGMSYPADLTERITGFRGRNISGIESFPYLFNKLDIETPILFKGKYVNDDGERTLEIKPLQGDSDEIKANSFGVSGFDSFSTNEDPLNFKRLNFRFSENFQGKIHEGNQIWDSNNKTVRNWTGEQERLRASFLPTTFYFLPIIELIGYLDVENELGTVVNLLQALDKRIRTINVIGNKVYVDIGLKRKVPLSFQGEGTGRLTALAGAAIKNNNGILLVDEIDTGLHYTTLQNMWKLMFFASEKYNLQLFATTHSDECVRALSDVIKEQFEAKKDVYTELDDVPACMIRLEGDDESNRAVYYRPEIIEAALRTEAKYR